MTSTGPSTGKKIAMGLLWVLIALELLSMAAAGASKFQGDGWRRMFEGWGYPAWGALVIGAAEFVGALALAVPKLASYSAAMLIVIMLGAIWTVIDPSNTTGLGPGIPALNIAALSIIMIARRDRRWRPGSTDQPTGAA